MQTLEYVSQHGFDKNVAFDNRWRGQRRGIEAGAVAARYRKADIFEIERSSDTSLILRIAQARVEQAAIIIHAVIDGDADQTDAEQQHDDMQLPEQQKANR